MLSADISRCGHLAKNVVDAQQGVIHALFKNSLYLADNKSLCCIGNTTLVGGPLNIQTSLPADPDHFTDLKVGDPWLFQNHQLTIADRIRLSTANTVYRLSYTHNVSSTNSRSTSKHLSAVTRTIDNVVTTYASGNRNQNKTTIIINKHLHSYRQCISDWISSIKKQEPSAIPNKLIGLIGCGEGLTPAGDDILLGVLVTLYHFGQHSAFYELRNWVLQYSSGRTNDISQAHLAAACDGQATDQLHILLQTVSDYTVSTAYRDSSDPAVNPLALDHLSVVCEHLCSHGHSSGYWTLTGVLVVLLTL